MKSLHSSMSLHSYNMNEKITIDVQVDHSQQKNFLPDPSEENLSFIFSVAEMKESGFWLFRVFLDFRHLDVKSETRNNQMFP